MNIRLHIERLVVDGLPVTSAQGRRLQSAVEAELQSLLSANGLSHEFQSGVAVPAVRVGGFQATPNATPVQLGKQIARSVYGGIGKPK
jgi:hypothetical protein